MSWIIDALKEPFEKMKMSKKTKKQTKEEQLQQLEEIRKELEAKEKKIKAEPEIELEKVEVPAPPKPISKHLEPTEQKQLTVEEKLQILEDNILVIANDLNDRLSSLERAFIKLK